MRVSLQMKCHVSTEGDAYKEPTVILQKINHIILGKRKQYAAIHNKTASILETIKTKSEYSDQQLGTEYTKMLSAVVWMINFGSFSLYFHMFLNFSVCTCAIL